MLTRFFTPRVKADNTATVDLTEVTIKVNNLLAEEVLATTPNALLGRIRELYSNPWPTEDDILLLAILVRQLDVWVSQGNTPPTAWQGVSNYEGRHAA